MENKSLPATQGSSNAGPQDPEHVFCVLTVVMTLSKHTPGSCRLGPLCHLSFIGGEKKALHYCSLDSGFLRDQESKEHFVQAAKPALLSEAREVRLRGESLSQTIKEISHTQQAGGEDSGKSRVLDTSLPAQSRVWCLCRKAILGVGMVQLVKRLPHKHEAWCPTSRVHITELGVAHL